MFIIDKQIKTACKKFLEDLNLYKEEQNCVYSTILYFIHIAPNLSFIFLHWTNLDSYEKFMLNIQIKYCVSIKCSKFLYAPLICAFQTWNVTQDTCGAPGFASNPSTLELSETTDRKIFKLLTLIGKLIDFIEIKREVLKEIKSFKEHDVFLENEKFSPNNTFSTCRNLIEI